MLKRNRPWKKHHDLIALHLHFGLITKPDQCENCGKSAKLDAHHEDYAKPLDVIWACKPCHGLLNRAKNQRGYKAVLEDVVGDLDKAFWEDVDTWEKPAC